MECSQAQERLSAHFDGELSDDERAAVAKHLTACEACSAELARFEQLSEMARGLESPTPPVHIWSQLERELDGTLDDAKVAPARRGQPSFRSMRRMLAVAATILAVTGLGWWGISTFTGPGENAVFAAELEHYLSEFTRDPANAQQFLLDKYKGRSVDDQQAVQQVGYRPAAADGLPEGYSVAATYVMQMPCCTCVQCVCQRSDGTTIVIFEHYDDVAEHGSGVAGCDGTPCSLAALDNRIVANWQRGGQHFTVVGLRDAAELARLADWLDDRKQIATP